MSDPAFRDALLYQNGKTGVDQELSNLRRIVDAEQRRARRLALGAIAIWIVWPLMLALSLGLPYIAARRGGPPPAASTQPAAQVQQPTPASPRHPTAGAAGTVVGLVLVAAFFALPLVGIVLTVMAILARRTASMSLIRSSLASIDAQLRLLNMGGGQGPRHG